MADGFVIPDDAIGSSAPSEVPTPPAFSGFVVPDATTSAPSAFSSMVEPVGGNPSGDFLGDFVDPAIKDLVESGSSLTGYQIGKKVTQAALGRIPGVKAFSKPLSALGGLIAGTGGDVAGEVISEPISNMMKGKEGGLVLPSKEDLVAELPRHAVETVGAVTLDKLTNKIFGTPTKTGARLKNDAAENLMSVIGVDPAKAKFLVADDVAQEIMPEIAEDILAVQKDGLFSIGTNRKALAYQTKKKVEELGSAVDNALTKVNAEETAANGLRFESKVTMPTLAKLNDLKTWAKDNYKDAALNKEANDLIDEATNSALELFASDKFDLVTLNKLKQNYYSDKAKYMTGAATASQVTNTTSKKIANVFKQVVEDVYKNSPYKPKEIPDISPVNKLLSNYLTVDELLQAPVARVFTEKPLAAGIAAQSALSAGALTHALTSGTIDPLSMTGVVGGSILASQLSKQPVLRGPLASVQAPLGQALQSGAEMVGSVPGLETAVRGAYTAGRGVVGQQGAEMASRAQEVLAPSTFQKSIIPRNTQKVFSLQDGEIPEELKGDEKFKQMLEQGQDVPDFARRQLLSQYLIDNPKARRYFDVSPYKGYMAIQGEDGSYYLLDQNQKDSFANEIKLTEPSTEVRSRILKELNLTGRIIKGGSVELPKDNKIELKTTKTMGGERQDDPY